jgi:hypothetical protein
VTANHVGDRPPTALARLPPSVDAEVLYTCWQRLSTRKH